MKEGLNRYCEISFSGRPAESETYDVFNPNTETYTIGYDTKQKVSYFYQKQWDGKTIQESLEKPTSYTNLFNDKGEIGYLIITDGTFHAETDYGVYKIASGTPGNSYSIYKKEMADGITYYSPVAIGTTQTTVYDFNVTAGREYQYIAYSAEGNPTAIQKLEQPIKVDWDCWSLTELTPVRIDTASPAIKKAYVANPTNVWLFKYDVESGDQAQNISKTEQKTLGQFPRFAHGRQNNISSSVSCYLGSEIINLGCLTEEEKIPYAQGYLERLPWKSHLTTNQKVMMLQEWRKVVASKNPKLIKDRKGQAFIVQITNGSNKPTDNIGYQPDKINFSWTQIASLDDTIITGGN